MADPATYPCSTIAKLLDLTERRVRQLSSEGVIPRSIGHGQYEPVGSIRGYIKYLTARAVLGAAVAGGADDAGASRLRLLQAKARIAVGEADMLEGLSIRRAAVEASWVQIITDIRVRMLALPNKAANALVHLRTPAEIEALLVTAVLDALGEETSAQPVYGDDPAEGTTTPRTAAASA